MARKTTTNTKATATPVAQTLVNLDPTAPTTVLGANMRLTDRDTVAKDGPFIDSVQRHGVLSPVLAYREGENVVIYAGQRRFHAAAITGQPLPALVREQAPEDLDRLTGQWDENERRADMTDTDRITGIEQMALVGVSADQIAKATHLDTEAVQAALTVAKSTHRQTATEQNLTLDQAHGLTEFEDDEDATQTLLTALDEGDGFDHTLARLRRDRAEDQVRAAATADLTERGITILDSQPEYGGKAERVHNLVDATSGEDLDAEAHEKCDGHAVYVRAKKNWDTGEMEAEHVLYCTDPKGNGHRDRYGQSTGRTAGPMSEEEKAERRRVVANNKAWDAATEVRRTWLAKFVQRKTPPTGAEALITAAITGLDQWGPSTKTHRDACTAVGLDADKTGKEIGNSRTTVKRQTVLALAHVLGQWEAGAGRTTWRNPNPWDARILTTLAGWGYTLSEVEQEVTKTKRK